VILSSRAVDATEATPVTDGVLVGVNFLGVVLRLAGALQEVLAARGSDDAGDGVAEPSLLGVRLICGAFLIGGEVAASSAITDFISTLIAITFGIDISKDEADLPGHRVRFPNRNLGGRG
jgi:hypothetical protein